MIGPDDIDRQLDEGKQPYLFDHTYVNRFNAAAGNTGKRFHRISRFLGSRFGLVSDSVKEERREIALNDPGANAHYPSNQIRTAKYYWYNAVPKFLYEQFSRFANLYFLFVGVLYLIDSITPSTAGSRFGQIISLSIVLGITAVKEGYEDFWRHREDGRLNRSKAEVLGSKGECKWGELRVGDVIRLEDQNLVPADIVLVASCESDGLAYIETKQLDGESNLKVKFAPPLFQERFHDESKAAEVVGSIECDHPNDRIYEFSGFATLKIDGKDEHFPLGLDQFLPRGCKLRNTPWIHGLIVNTGPDTKIARNNKPKPRKRSTLEKRLDIFLVITFLTQIFLVIIIVGISAATCYANERSGTLPWYLSSADACDPFDFFLLFFTYIAATANMVPLALYVSMEIARLFQALFMGLDDNFYDADRDMRLSVRTSNLNEECGNVSYLFSDKTGTLTSNCMVFKKFVIDNGIYEEKPTDDNAESLEDLRADLEAINRVDAKHGNGRSNVEFFRLLSMCNSVVIEEEKYVGTSPDEVALVTACKEMGYEFEGRTNKDMTVNVCGRSETWELLGVLEFNSSRKRMSVIVRSPYDGRIRIYCKGADFVIFKLLAEGQNDEADRLSAVLDRFAASGLRTLTMCYREVEQDEFTAWYQEFSRTQALTEGREAALEEVATRIESNMTLLGATAIEDSLQEEVPETLKALEHAGIKTWILTGDKQETAINIGVSCGLLADVVNLVVINEDSFEDVEAQMDRAIGVWRSLREMMGKASTNFGLVIDGHTLQFVLKTGLEKKLVLLGKMCKTVLACRVAPKQKTELVEAVRAWDKDKVTMAIGDGANDVGMIGAAHVGIGIVGVEGVEAKLASDFAFTRFRYLQRLLLVHGRWNYRRMTKMALYIIYKSITVALLEVYFAFYNDYSGQLFVDPMLAGLYNVLLSAVLPVVLGVYDRDMPAKYALMFPEVYRRGQQRILSGYRSFLWWYGLSFYQAAIAFFFPVAANFEGPQFNGRLIGMSGFAATAFTCVLTIVNFQLLLTASSWNPYTFILWIFFATFIFYGGLIFSSPGVSFDSDLSPLWLDAFQEIYASWGFWFLLLAAVVAGCAPVLLKQYVQRQEFPHEKTIVQELMKAGLTREDVLPEKAIPEEEVAEHAPVLDRRGVEYTLRDVLMFDYDNAGGGMHQQYNPVIGIMNRHRRLKRTLSDSNLQQVVFTDHNNVEEQSKSRHKRNITVGF